MGESYSAIGVYLDNCRRKRNASEYDAAGMISEKEVEDLLKTVKKFRTDVEAWLGKEYPGLV
jgi:hypothetical protein